MPTSYDVDNNEVLLLLFGKMFVVASLFYRLKFEKDIGASPLLSMVIGASLILIIWSLIKLKILNPNWFGFFQSKKLKS